MKKKSKVWFITGASKGFGLEITKAVLANGDKVVATVRNHPERLHELLKNDPSLLTVMMDVTREAEVQQAVESAREHFKTIDVLVNNAGYGIVTAVEEASDAEVRQQYDTNVFGLLNVVRAVLPVMRQQRSGHIINISSMGGYDAMAGWGIYGSTKFAVEGLSKALAIELLPLGIKVTAVAPGVFRTEFLGADSFKLADKVIDDYKETSGFMRDNVGNWYGSQPGDPRKLAKIIADLPDSSSPPLHLPLGKDSLKMYWDNSARTAAEIRTWSDIAASTDFTDTFEQ